MADEVVKTGNKTCDRDGCFDSRDEAACRSDHVERRAVVHVVACVVRSGCGASVIDVEFARDAGDLADGRGRFAGRSDL